MRQKNYEWEREKKKKEEEKGGDGGDGGGGGEQIKGCQMEILGFKRSETGVKRVCLFPSRLYVMLIGDKYLRLGAG